MEIDLADFFAPGHFNQGLHMALVAVHAAVPQKTHQVKPVALSLCLSQRSQKSRVVTKLALIDILVDQSQILVDDAAGAEDHVTDFRISHLAVRQTDIHSGHGETRYRKIPIQPIDVRGRSLSNGIPFFSRIDSPSIQDHKDHGLLGTQEFSFLVEERSGTSLTAVVRRAHHPEFI
jgi:hypothetical protein